MANASYKKRKKAIRDERRRLGGVKVIPEKEFKVLQDKWRKESKNDNT